MNRLTYFYLSMMFSLASCSLFDVNLDGKPEGAYPLSHNFDSVMVIVAWDSVLVNNSSNKSRIAYLVNTSFPPTSVNYIVRGVAYPHIKSSIIDDSLFVTTSFSKGDTLTINTVVVDTTYHTDPNEYIQHIPEYNPEKKRWRVATHAITRLHTINGVPVRQ